MRILIIDNYDSFTYNLYHYVEKCGVEVDVIRNDELVLEEVDNYDKLILSPGPGLPSETKMMFELLSHYFSTKPILGVCLGMQGIAEFFNARLVNQKEVKHGVQTTILVQYPSLLYKGLANEFKVGLYHSWCVDEGSIPSFLNITGKSSEGIVMSIEHNELPIYGVQFHPESIMTDFGIEMI